MASDVLQGVRRAIQQARHVVILTGAGVSAESGIPTFRGAGGLWRRFRAENLATWEAFERDPALVWEFYQYRRDVVSRCAPNAGHHAIAAFQQRMAAEGRRCTLVTQNIDRLHHAAGSSDVVEMHGSLWLVKYSVSPTEDAFRFLEADGEVWEDRTNPIVPALAGLGLPDSDVTTGSVPLADLPRRDGRLLRPAVVWFGEQLDARVTKRVHEALTDCDLLLTVGTSGVVYPAAGYGHQCRQRGVPVVEFNTEDTGSTCSFRVLGPCGTTLPAALVP